MNRLVTNTASAFAVLVASSLAGATGASAAAALRTAQPAVSTVTAAADSPAIKAAESDKVVCRRLPSTGTRMAKRACLTREQWKEITESDRF